MIEHVLWTSGGFSAALLVAMFLNNYNRFLKVSKYRELLRQAIYYAEHQAQTSAGQLIRELVCAIEDILK